MTEFKQGDYVRITEIEGKPASFTTRIEQITNGYYYFDNPMNTRERIPVKVGQLSGIKISYHHHNADMVLNQVYQKIEKEFKEYDSLTQYVTDEGVERTRNVLKEIVDVIHGNR